MGAKPVLDVMLVLKNPSDIFKAIHSLEAYGFTHKGDILSHLYENPETRQRQFFSFYDDDDATDFIHLHMLLAGHPDVKKHLEFRDRLRSSRKLRQDYEDLKLELKNKGASRREYTTSKSDFVRSTIGTS